jgi:predicted outer membrane repeat protein
MKAQHSSSKPLEQRYLMEILSKIATMASKEASLVFKVVLSLTIQALFFNVSINKFLLFIDNSASKGGAFKVTASKLFLFKSEFIHNYAVEGGVVH